MKNQRETSNPSLTKHRDGGVSSLPKGTRIAILGAGATGITFARTLRDLGYTNVTLFEKESRVGGKCCTTTVDGKPHDMGGAAAVPSDYANLLALSASLGFETEKTPRVRFYSIAQGREVPLMTFYETVKAAAQLVKYISLHMLKWNGVAGADLQEVSPELYAPWSKVAEDRRLETFSHATKRFRVAYGYGYDDEVPAAYMANYIRPKTVTGVYLPWNGLCLWKNGLQPIWEKASAELDVRTGCAVTHVKRDDKITLTVKTVNGIETLEFDKMVLTFNPKTALSVLDATAAEKELYSQIQTVDYRTYVIDANGMLEQGQTGSIYINENMQRAKNGHPLLMFKRHADQNTFVFYVIADSKTTDEQVIEAIQADISVFGGTLGKTRCVRHWDYFPHVNSRELADGFHRNIHSLQGVNNTYVAGEALTFSLIPRVMENAKHVATMMVNNTFPAVRRNGTS
ncbi:MAG TPA: FAD-dependent oxidoreductase [Spirochaetota bacterium]|nr:FAD-dependent oxidoreductase [Spirochaetota bacterium]